MKDNYTLSCSCPDGSFVEYFIYNRTKWICRTEEGKKMYTKYENGKWIDEVIFNRIK